MDGYILYLQYAGKVLIHPNPAEDFSEIFERASIYHLVPGWVVIASGIIFNVALFAVAISTMKKRTETITIYPSERSKFKLPNI
jgi:hypothetical protein